MRIGWVFFLLGFVIYALGDVIGPRFGRFGIVFDRLWDGMSCAFAFALVFRGRPKMRGLMCGVRQGIMRSSCFVAGLWSDRKRTVRVRMRSFDHHDPSWDFVRSECCDPSSVLRTSPTSFRKRSNRSSIAGLLWDRLSISFHSWLLLTGD